MPPIVEYGIYIIYIPADFPDYIFNRHGERLTNCYPEFQIWNNDLETTSSFSQSFKVLYSPPTQSGEVVFPFLQTYLVCSNWAWLRNARSVLIVTITHTNWRQHCENRITKTPPQLNIHSIFLLFQTFHAAKQYHFSVAVLVPVALTHLFIMQNKTKPKKPHAPHRTERSFSLFYPSANRCLNRLFFYINTIRNYLKSMSFQNHVFVTGNFFNKKQM